MSEEKKEIPRTLEVDKLLSKPLAKIILNTELADKLCAGKCKTLAEANHALLELADLSYHINRLKVYALEKLKRPNLRSEVDKLLKKIEQRIPRVCKPIRSLNSKTKFVDQLYEAGSDLDGGYRIYWKSKVGQLKTSKPVVLWCGLKKTQASDVKIAFDLMKVAREV